MSNIPPHSFQRLVIRHQYILTTITDYSQFPIHPFKDVHQCSRKKLFEYLEAPVRWRFQKIALLKVFGNFRKISTLEKILSTLVGLEVFQETTQDSNSLENLLANVFVRWNFTRNLVSGIFWNFKSTQSLRLQFVDLKLLKRNFITEPFQEISKISKIPLRKLVRGSFLVAFLQTVRLLVQLKGNFSGRNFWKCYFSKYNNARDRVFHRVAELSHVTLLNQIVIPQMLSQQF